MAILELTRAPARLGVLRARAAVLAGRIAGFAAEIGNRIELRNAERTLNGMSDHMLKDIGISRADIHHRVRGLD